MPAATAVKRFWCIRPENDEITMEFFSKTPRDAALKAATRDEARICLVDVDAGKLHVFVGERRPLNESQTNAFTQRKNITSRPFVAKMAYRNLNQACERKDVERLAQEFREMLS